MAFREVLLVLIKTLGLLLQLNRAVTELFTDNLFSVRRKYRLLIYFQ